MNKRQHLELELQHLREQYTELAGEDPQDLRRLTRICNAIAAVKKQLNMDDDESSRRHKIRLDKASKAREYH